MYSSAPECISMGTFVIDLSGTPFSLAYDTKWSWNGTYSRGSIMDGHAQVKNSSNVSVFNP